MIGIVTGSCGPRARVGLSRRIPLPAREFSHRSRLGGLARERNGSTGCADLRWVFACPTEGRSILRLPRSGRGQRSRGTVKWPSSDSEPMLRRM